MSARRRRRIPTLLATAGLVFSALIGVAGTGVAAAGNSNVATLVNEPLTGQALAGPWVLPATSSGPNRACLAGGGGTAAAPFPTCGNGDTPASGAEPGLQLTDNETNQEGGAAYGLSVPTVDGIDATFNTYQYDPQAGTGSADGIAFYLAATDPANPQPPTLGAAGGALAYAVNGANGLSNAYLGFGLDVYGNYDNPAYNGSGCTASSAFKAEQVDVRGPGNGTTGYCVIASTYDPSTGASSLGGNLDNGGGATGQAVPVEVAVNPTNTPATTTSGITVPVGSWVTAVKPIVSGGMPGDGGVTGCPTGYACLTGPLPSITSLGTPSSWLDTNGVPKQLAFGWTGSTGTSTDYHVVSGLDVTTLTGIPPTYTAGLTDDTGGSAVGTNGHVTFTASATLSGTAEQDPVTITDQFPSGLASDGTAPPVTSDGGAGGTFNCPTPSAGATSESCTYTPPGTGLSEGATLTVKYGATVTATSATQATLTDQVTVSSPDGFAGSASDPVQYGGTPSVSASLSTSAPTVAGVEAVNPSALTSAEQGTASPSADAADAPLDSLHVPSIHVPSIGLNSPIASIHVPSIHVPSITVTGSTPSGLAADEQALSQTLLSNLSVQYPLLCGNQGYPACSGWAGILARTPYAGAPLESVTLADVLADPVASVNFDTLDLGSFDLSGTALDSLSAPSIELGGTTLDDIGLGGTSTGASALAVWCAELTSLGSSAAAFGIDCSSSSTNVTLLDLQLAGLDIASLHVPSIHVPSIDLSSDSPLGGMTLGTLDVASTHVPSIPIDDTHVPSIPLGDAALSSITNLSEIVDCTRFAALCSSSTATLADAYTAGAILASATIGQLSYLPQFGQTTVAGLLSGDDFGDPNYPTLTLGDLIISSEPPATYQWQAVNLSNIPLAANEVSGQGGTVQYSANLNVTNAPTSASVSATLPGTFAYVPGSSSLDGTEIAAPGIGGANLTWALPVLSVGSHTLTFSANAGIGLGPVTTNLSVTYGAHQSTASVPVDVVDGEQPQIDSGGTPVPLSTGTVNATTTPGNLELGYLTSPGDLNDWSVAVPDGAELSVALTNVPATYDLEVFGPGGQQLQGTPNQVLPPVTDTVPSLDSSSTTEATPGSQDLPVTPPPGDQLIAVANDPTSQSQYIQTPPLPGGTYVVQVSGYNGTYSPQPYALQANVLGGGPAATCPESVLTYAIKPDAYPSGMSAPGAPTIPNGVNTLFLVDTERLADMFTPTDEANVMTDLQQVATDAKDGVIGAIVPVDAYLSVQSAYQAWDTNPCSVTGANSVVAAISQVVDEIRANHPTVQNVVIVGADSQVPFARVADGTPSSNERDYGSQTFAGENNPEADALAQGYYLSDDPYAANNPLGVGSATLYTPQVAVGRLVETPSQIESALTRFLTTHGDVNAAPGLTTGYSLVAAGATAINTELNALGVKTTPVINSSWTSEELQSDLGGTGAAPGIVSFNAHFDYGVAEPAYDDTNGTPAIPFPDPLYSTSGVRNQIKADPNAYIGSLLFSVGCHSGLEIDTNEVQTSTGQSVDDWAKTFADAGALWVANTGYGYSAGDISYSPKLMTEFAGNLGTMTVGEALTSAKQQYMAGNAILSAYDLKAIMESTLYGLPFYHLNGVGTPATPPSGPPTSAGTAPLNALTVGTFSTSQPTGPATGDLTPSTTGGTQGYYYYNNGNPALPGIQATEWRPIEPLVTVPATESGLVPHGALLTTLTSNDVNGFTPTYSLPAVGSADSTSPPIGNAAFPGTLQRVATYSTFTSNGTGTGAQVDLVAGQFLPDPSHPGSGTQRLFTQMGGQILYDAAGSALADDYIPPTIVTSQAAGGTSGPTAFAVQVSPSGTTDPVVDVVVLSTDGASPGSWTSTTLTSTDGLNWTGMAAATTSRTVQYFVEAVDEAGNVAVSNNEGYDFNGTPTNPVSISLSGTKVNGLYTGPVGVGITAPTGSTYTVNGGSPSTVNGSVTESNAGQYTITVSDGQGHTATVGFTISTAQTVTKLSSSANPSVYGQPVTVTAAVTPASSGQTATPTGSVVFLDNGQRACAASLTNGTATCQLPTGALGPQTITAQYQGDGTFAGSSDLLGQVVNQSPTSVSVTSSANPSVSGQSVTFTATVSIASPGTGTLAGTVSFVAGNTAIPSCTNVTLTSGKATCNYALSALGVNTITATYSGGMYFVSSSGAFSEVVSAHPCAGFSGCNLKGANLAGANLAGVNMADANLQGANLAGATLTGATMSGDNLLGANLSSVKAQGLLAIGVNLNGANLNHGDFSCLNGYSCSNFSNSNMSSAVLDYANFIGANLTGANLHGASETGTKFS